MINVDTTSMPRRVASAVGEYAPTMGYWTAIGCLGFFCGYVLWKCTQLIKDA
jgi:hypothetical protein